MALFKAKIKLVQIAEGVIEADSKEIILEELAKTNSPQWWALKNTIDESRTAEELVELEEKPS